MGLRGSEGVKEEEKKGFIDKQQMNVMTNARVCGA